MLLSMAAVLHALLLHGDQVELAAIDHHPAKPSMRQPHSPGGQAQTISMAETGGVFDGGRAVQKRLHAFAGRDLVGGRGGPLCNGYLVGARLDALRGRVRVQNMHDAGGAHGVADGHLVQLRLHPRIGQMDGELSGGDVGQDGHQGDKEHNRGEPDEQVGKDQLVAQAPQHVPGDQPPQQRHRDADDGDADKHL
jgi:hypothetical protein